jgi:hypothetical protein
LGLEKGFPLKSSIVFGANWGFNGAIHETQKVFKRDTRCNFMVNIASLGLSIVVPYMINMKMQI